MDALPAPISLMGTVPASTAHPRHDLFSHEFHAKKKVPRQLIWGMVQILDLSGGAPSKVGRHPELEPHLVGGKLPPNFSP